MCLIQQPPPHHAHILTHAEEGLAAFHFYSTSWATWEALPVYYYIVRKQKTFPKSGKSMILGLNMIL